MQTSLLLASGGVDSTVLLYYLVLKKDLDLVLVADYGQASFKRQWSIVEWHAHQLDVPVKRLHVPYPAFAHRREFRRAGFKPRRRRDTYFHVKVKGAALERYLREEYVWLEGRNSLIYLHAGIYAACNQYDVIYNGLQYDAIEWRKYRQQSKPHGDATPYFVRVMGELFRIGLRYPVKIKAPFYDKKYDKARIVRLGRSLDVPIEYTYSCEFFPPCGTCHHCRLIRHFGIKQKGHAPEGEL